MVLIPNDYAQVTLGFTGVAIPLGAACTLGLNVELYPGDPTAAALDIAQDVLPAMSAYVVNKVAITSIKVKFGPTQTGPSAEIATNIPGLGNLDPAPPNTALLVRKITGFGGRQGTGRWYWPGIADTQIDDGGNLGPATVTSLQTGFNSFHSNLVASGLVPVLLHGEDEPISTPMPITSFSVQSRVATQRRRLRR